MRHHHAVGLAAFALVLAGCLIAPGAEMSVLPLPDGIRPDFYIAFSPDNKLLVASASKADSGRCDWSIIVWDVARHRIVRTIPLPGKDNRAQGLAFSPDSRTLASEHESGAIRLWNVEDWKPTELRAASSAACPVGRAQVVFLPDGERLAVGRGDPDQPITVWDVKRRRQVAALKSGGGVYALRFLPDGKTLAAAVVVYARNPRNAGRRPNQVRGELQYWDTETYKRQRTVPGFAIGELSQVKGLNRANSRLGVPGFGMALSPDAKLAATTYLDRIALWNADTGRGFPIGSHGAAVMESVFSPDSGMLATTAEGPGTQNDSAAVMLWSVPDGRLLGSLEHPDRTWLMGLAFSADGKLVATTATNKRAYLWNLLGFGDTPSVSPSDSLNAPQRRQDVKTK